MFDFRGTMKKKRYPFFFTACIKFYLILQRPNNLVGVGGPYPTASVGTPPGSYF
jgi:hypothetical protein